MWRVWGIWTVRRDRRIGCDKMGGQRWKYGHGELSRQTVTPRCGIDNRDNRATALFADIDNALLHLPAYAVRQ